MGIDPRIRALYYMCLFGVDEMILRTIFQTIKDQEAGKIIWDLNEKSNYDHKGMVEQLVKELMNEQD